MAKIEAKLPKEELDLLVKQFIEKKKINPSRIDRPLTYKIYNQFFNDKQRDVLACTCHDRDCDLKVVKYIELHYKVEEPIQIQSSVKIDMGSMMKPKAKRKTTTKKKKGDEGTNV